jgi:hypothetical protein
MSGILESDYNALVADNKRLSLENIEVHDLRAAFLETTSKLAIICAAFGIDGRLPQTETRPFFKFAVDERLKREQMLKQMLRTATEKAEKMAGIASPQQAQD